ELRRFSLTSQVARIVEPATLTRVTAIIPPSDATTLNHHRRPLGNHTDESANPPTPTASETTTVLMRSCPCSNRRSAAVGVYDASSWRPPPRPVATNSSTQVPTVKPRVTIAAAAAPLQIAAAAAATPELRITLSRCPPIRFRTSGEYKWPPYILQSASASTPGVQASNHPARITTALAASA